MAGEAPADAARGGLDRCIDRLERVMPDLAQIGLAMLVLAACAAGGWIDLGVEAAATPPMEATALESTGPVAF